MTKQTAHCTKSLLSGGGSTCVRAPRRGNTKRLCSPEMRGKENLSCVRSSVLWLHIRCVFCGPADSFAYLCDFLRGISETSSFLKSRGCLCYPLLWCFFFYYFGTKDSRSWARFGKKKKKVIEKGGTKRKHKRTDSCSVVCS